MPLGFSVSHLDATSAARRGRVTTAHGAIETPAFMTVGTRATVTGIEPHDLRAAGAQILLGNTYHLMLRPGLETFRRVGGIHAFMGWNGPILTDSGGYQIFSLPGDRVITEKGAKFRAYTDNREHLLSPENSIEMQTAIGSDIMVRRPSSGHWVRHPKSYRAPSRREADFGLACRVFPSNHFVRRFHRRVLSLAFPNCLGFDHFPFGWTL